MPEQIEHEGNEERMEEEEEEEEEANDHTTCDDQEPADVCTDENELRNMNMSQLMLALPRPPHELYRKYFETVFYHLIMRITNPLMVSDLAKIPRVLVEYNLNFPHWLVDEGSTIIGECMKCIQSVFRSVGELRQYHFAMEITSRSKTTEQQWRKMLRGGEMSNACAAEFKNKQHKTGLKILHGLMIVSMFVHEEQHPELFRKVLKGVDENQQMDTLVTSTKNLELQSKNEL